MVPAWIVDLVPAGAPKLAGESQPGAGAAPRGTGPRTRAASGGADGDSRQRPRFFAKMVYE